MYYIKLIIITILIILGGCTTTPSTDISPGPSVSTTKDNRVKVNKSSGDEIAQYRQAITELNNGNLEKAKLQLLEIVKIQPDLAGPWGNLALIYIKQGQLNRAEENLEIALKNNPNMAQLLNMAGYLETKKGNINVAIDLYEKAITQKPDYALAHYNLALLYDIYLQDLPKAVEYYEKYLALIGTEDKKTKDWVEELKLNIAREKS